MRVQPIEPSADARSVLRDAQFADAFVVQTDEPTIDARQAAERMLSRSPVWVHGLLALRDILVSPFGLRSTREARDAPGNKVGMFPVLAETPQRLIAGFDDSHLDFRLVVDVTSKTEISEVTATTVVLTHNLLGRSYLMLIEPFHRLVVRAMMRQIARPV